MQIPPHCKFFKRFFPTPSEFRSILRRERRPTCHGVTHVSPVSPPDVNSSSGGGGGGEGINNSPLFGTPSSTPDRNKLPQHLAPPLASLSGKRYRRRRRSNIHHFVANCGSTHAKVTVTSPSYNPSPSIIIVRQKSNHEFIVGDDKRAMASPSSSNHLILLASQLVSLSFRPICQCLSSLSDRWSPLLTRSADFK